VWHGTDDPIVKPSNGEDIIRQWINVHGLSDSSSYQELIGTHTRRTWTDANGNALIEAFSIRGMGHGVPLATGVRGGGYGAPGAFFLDVGIASTHHIAHFWRLHESYLEAPRAAQPISAPIRIPQEGRAGIIAGATAEGLPSLAEDRRTEGEEQRAHKPFDPNGVIAASFKAAGLPVPEMPPNGRKRVAPGPIIAAALKAAGLAQS